MREVDSSAVRRAIDDAKHPALLMVDTVSSLGYRKLSAEDRDLDQARLAIESLGAILPVLEESVPDDVIRDFRQVTANLQLAYADATRP